MVDFQEALYAYLQLLRGIFYPNKKSWHNVHAFPVKPKILLETFYKIYFFNLFYRSINGFISVSKSCTNSLREFSYGNKLNYHTIYNGVKLNKFKKINLKKINDKK